MIFYGDILREFKKQKVKYVIVGGLAMNLLGSLRTTGDIDILVEMSDKNLTKVVKILIKNGFLVKQPVDPIDFANDKIRENWIKNKHMKAFNFYKDEGLQEVDIIIESPVSYQDARNSMVKIRCGDLVFPVISIENLIKMKKKANRPIDRIDVEELKKIKRLSRKLK